MQNWPSAFPRPSTEFAADVAMNTIRTSMDSGRIRQRRRFSVEEVVVNARWEVADIEAGIFTAFHKFKINLGADWFLMELPLGGQGMQVHTVRFKDGRYSQDYDDVGHWIITAQLEVQQRVTFTEDLLNFYLDFGFSDSELTNLIASANSFHVLVHVTLPPLLGTIADTYLTNENGDVLVNEEDQSLAT